MRFNGMSCLADLQGRYSRDGNACHRLRHLHIVRHRPRMSAHLQLGGNAVARDSCHHFCGCRYSSTDDEFLSAAACTSSDGSHAEAFPVLPQLDGCLHCHWVCIPPTANLGVSPACIDDDICRTKALAVVSSLEATGCVHGK